MSAKADRQCEENPRESGESVEIHEELPSSVTESDYESATESPEIISDDNNDYQPFGERDYLGSRYQMVDKDLPPVKDINAPPKDVKRKSYYRDERVMLMEKGPKTFKEAMKRSDSEKWLEAINVEMKSQIKMGTWELVPLPEGRKLVDCKWVLGIKLNSEGKPARYKARLCARGFSQEYGVDYEETFAPVVHFNSLRVFLVIAVYLKMDVQQMDVVTAFLNGVLDEEIYMKQPPGFEKEGNLVCKLKKGIYGLKQSPRQWNKLLNEFLEQKGFKRSKVDPCIYLKGTKDVIMIALYVDDLIIASTSSKLMAQTKLDLNKRFEMKDLGKLHFCLGVEIIWDKSGSCSLNQQNYVKAVLEKFNMQECKPVSTPMNAGVKLVKDMCPKTQEELEEMEKVPYRSAVGSLIYLVTGTRPDIAVAVGEVAI